MKRHIGELEGQVIEAITGDYGGEQVLLNGRVVSKRLLAGLGGAGRHSFEFVDAQGRSRACEVRWLDRSAGLGLAHRVVVLVDGVERAVLAPQPLWKGAAACVHCGYSLAGLPVENAEVRCPECGRHVGAEVLGLEKGAAQVPPGT